MEYIESIEFWLALGLAIFLTVGFDSILHGLSHGDHGFVNRLWEGEKNQRSDPTLYINDIGWHIIADIVIGIIIVIGLFSFKINELNELVLFVLVLGLLSFSQWIHAYAAYQVKGRVIAGLGILSITQILIASSLVSIIFL
jgi:hypothetical protein